MAEESFKASPRRWFLLAGVSLSIFLEVGVLKSYGVFVDDITRDIHTSTSLVGLMTGLAQGLTYILAPVNRFLLQYFSTRQLFITGSIIGSTFYMMASFSQSFPQFAIALTMSGLGYNMVTFPAHALPVHYFPDKFEFISSVIITSGGVGMMVLPVIAEQLKIIYGWRRAMLLLGAFSLHNIPVGALVKPKGTRPVQSAVSQKEPVNSENPVESYSSIDEKECLSESPQNSQADRQVEELASGLLNSNHDNASRASSTLNTGENVSSMVTDIAEDTFRESLWRSFKIIVGIDIVQKNMAVLSIILAMFWLGCSYSGWIVFFVPNAIAKGFSVETAVMLVTIGGAANIFGRFTIGFVSKSQRLSNHTTFLILSFLSALVYAMNNFATKFWTLCILAILNGSTLGAMTAMVNVLSRDSAPNGDVVGVLSLLLMAVGVGIPVGGFLVGYFFDQSKSYDQAFTFLGLTNLLSAICMVTPKAYRYVAQLMRHKETI